MTTYGEVFLMAPFVIIFGIFFVTFVIVQVSCAGHPDIKINPNNPVEQQIVAPFGTLEQCQNDFGKDWNERVWNMLGFTGMAMLFASIMTYGPLYREMQNSRVGDKT